MCLGKFSYRYRRRADVRLAAQLPPKCITCRPQPTFLRLTNPATPLIFDRLLRSGRRMAALSRIKQGNPSNVLSPALAVRRVRHSISQVHRIMSDSSYDYLFFLEGYYRRLLGLTLCLQANCDHSTSGFLYPTGFCDHLDVHKMRKGRQSTSPNQGAPGDQGIRTREGT